MPEKTWTILDVIRWTSGYFGDRGVDAPRLAAELLLAHVLGTTRLDLYLRFDQPLSPDELAAFRALIRRRAAREPLAYITGHREFWSLDLKVGPDVLVPRPETECVAEAAMGFLPEDRTARVLDLGTGTGAIVLAMAHEKPGHEYHASDASAAALDVARENAKTHGLAVTFHHGPWFAPFRQNGLRFDLVVSNPPYVATGTLETLAPEVRDHEPRGALDGGPDGLDAYRAILAEAPGHLAPGAVLVFEIGADQRESFANLVRRAQGFEEPEFRCDLAGLDRTAILRFRG